MTHEELKPIVESLLFVSKDPLNLDRIKAVIENTETTDIRKVLNQLSAEYEMRGGGFYLREIAGGWQLCSRPEYKPWIRRLIAAAPRLSKAAMETLAIIAWKQPIIRSDIERIRGVDCGGVLRILMERKLIRVLGRKEIPGRPLIYATTKQFLETFDLKDLKDLPTPKEIAELGQPLFRMSSDAPEWSEPDSPAELSREETENRPRLLIPYHPLVSNKI